MNPLIEKYEEIYGEKKVVPPVESVAEEKTGMERLKEVVARAGSSGTMGNDVISLGGYGGMSTTYSTDIGVDTVIPTAQKMPGGGINLTGDYLSVSICDSLNVLTTSQKTYTLPNKTSVEQGFNKVLNDISRGKAVISSIESEVDPLFGGFGGQIRYSVEIIGTYP